MNSIEGSGPAVVQLCDFCGCQQYTRGRCSGCGAASAFDPFTVIKRNPSATVGIVVKSKKYLIHFTVALLAGVLVQICIVPDYQSRSPFLSGAMVQDTADGQARKTFALDSLKREVAYSTVDLKHQLAAISSNYEMYYAGINRAATPTGQVVLNMQKTLADVVLVLSSFQAVHWNVANPYKVNIVAIVYASERGVSSVTGDLASALLLRSIRPVGSYYQSKLCNCLTPGVYQCAGDDLPSMVRRVESLGHGRLSGIASGFSAVSLLVPQTSLEKIQRRDMKHRRADAAIKSTCFRQVYGKSTFFKPQQTQPAD